MKPATYRYTRHMYSQLDNREIWSLLYDIGEVEKIGRIMMTGSAAFWHEFSLRLPDRVAIPQEEVIAYVYQGMREKLIASGKVPPELLQKLKEAEAANAEDDMTFEEGIEQLRQEGTDMGGSDYEVTLEDIKEKRKASTKKKYNAAKHDRDGNGSGRRKRLKLETNNEKISKRQDLRLWMNIQWAEYFILSVFEFSSFL